MQAISDLVVLACVGAYHASVSADCANSFPHLRCFQELCHHMRAFVLKGRVLIDSEMSAVLAFVKVRWMAFNEYQNALAPRSQQRLEEHKWPPVADAASSAPDTATSQPRPWPQSSSAGAAARTDSGRLCCGTAGSRRLPQQCSLRRRQRQLLCADEQLELLMANTSPADNLCE